MGLELVLGLALSTGSWEETVTTTTPSQPYSNKKLDDHLTLSFITSSTNNCDGSEEPSLTLGLELLSSMQQTTTNSPHSAVSSFSSRRVVVVKRERDLGGDDDRLEAEEAAETEMERVISSSRASDEEEDGGVAGSRKKLRLTKDQSALLEESFKQHSTLNPKQKQALARQLNLRPRQVEVWFQNRRARTKLKQTEVDCEFLKKCCETLTDENRRLQKELQELKGLKLPPHHPALYMPMPTAALTMCPSCERLCGGVNDDGGGGASNKISPFSLAPKPHFYNPFSNSSAAC